MGVTGLLPSCIDAMPKCMWEEFKGKVAAVDVSIWICGALFSGHANPQHSVVSRLLSLRKLGITPIAVFDGKLLEAKREVHEKRAEHTQKYQSKRAKLDASSAGEVDKRSVEWRSAVVGQVKELCKTHKIEVVQSPYESDAQIAYLLKTGVADVAISEDSDFIPFGCSKVLYKVDEDGGRLFEPCSLELSWEAPYKLESLRAVCIARGCDYAMKGVFNFGMTKAQAVYSELVLAPSPHDFNLVAYLIEDQGNVIVHDEFEETFQRAMNTFKHQLVFDTRSGKVVPLEAYPEGKSAQDFPYAGKMDEAMSIAIHVPGLRGVPADPTFKKFRRFYVCQRCPETFDSFKDLSDHRDNEHSKCGECGKVLDTYKALYQHLRIVHPKIKPIECPECGKKCTSINSAFHHMAQVHPKGDPEECPECGKKCRTKQTLKQHIAWVHTDSSEPLKCPECGKECKNELALKQHVKRGHTTELVPCPICGKEFKPSLLQQHMSGHPSPEGAVKCPECGKELRSKMALKNHMRNVHPKDGPFPCDVCGAEYRSKMALYDHKRRKGHK